VDPTYTCGGVWQGLIMLKACAGVWQGLLRLKGISVACTDVWHGGLVLRLKGKSDTCANVWHGYLVPRLEEKRKKQELQAPMCGTVGECSG